MVEMSKASKQSIALLAIVNGIFITIDHYNLSGEQAPTVDYGMEVCKEVITNFPETGDPKKNFKWMQSKIQESDKFLRKEGTNLYTAIVLTSLAQHIITDLIDKIDDPVKLKILEPLDDVITGLSEQIDPKGTEFLAYEEADRHLKKIYRLLEF